jgi:CheY-like chemotaxis protein
MPAGPAVDLILLDHQLPDTTGLKLMKPLRERAPTPR